MRRRSSRAPRAPCSTPHGLNIDNAAIIKTYTKLPVGCGRHQLPELCEQAIAEGKIDFAILGRQMLADPEFANKAKARP